MTIDENDLKELPVLITEAVSEFESIVDELNETTCLLVQEK